MTERRSLVCPICHRESFNPNDIRERYCGACHHFVDDQLTHLDALALKVWTQPPLALTLQAKSVLQLAGLMQLALRHPGLSSTLRATAERFLAGVRVYFADCPIALDIVHRGDDPREDR